MYVCIYIYTHTWICMFLYTYIYIHIFTHIHLHVYIRKYIHIFIFIQIYVYIYIFIHIFTCIHIHTYVFSVSQNAGKCVFIETKDLKIRKMSLIGFVLSPTHICIYVDIYIYTWTYIYIHINTYIYVHVRISIFGLNRRSLQAFLWKVDRGKGLRKPKRIRLLNGRSDLGLLVRNFETHLWDTSVVHVITICINLAS